MLRSVLVPLDQSPLSELALPVAGEIARRNAAVLHLVHAHEGIGWVLGLGQPVAMPGHGEADIQLEQAAWLQARAVHLERESGITVRWRLLQGRAAPAIDQYVRENDIDLVVMTTHGRGGLARAWLGSTTDGLLRTIHVPILLLRGNAQPPLAPLSRVLVALDGGPMAERALQTAASLRVGGHCTVLQVIAPRLAYPSHHVPDLEGQKADARAYLDGACRKVRNDWMALESRVRTGEDVAETILSEAGELAANLIVLGTHARTPVLRAMVGSIADKVIRGAEVPVLVAPPDAAAVAEA